MYAQLNSQMKEAYQELVVTRERLARNETEFGCLQRDVSRISGQVAALDAEAVNNRVNNQKTADALECLAKSTNDQFANVENAEIIESLNMLTATMSKLRRRSLKMISALKSCLVGIVGLLRQVKLLRYSLFLVL